MSTTTTEAATNGARTKLWFFLSSCNSRFFGHKSFIFLFEFLLQKERRALDKTRSPMHVFAT